MTDSDGDGFVDFKELTDNLNKTAEAYNYTLPNTTDIRLVFDSFDQDGNH